MPDLDVTNTILYCSRDLFSQNSIVQQLHGVADSTDQALLLVCVLEGPERSGDDDNLAAAKRRRLRQELIGETHPSAADAATNEIDHYLSLSVPAEFEDDPLRFWEKHQSSFPILSVVARVYLGNLVLQV